MRSSKLIIESNARQRMPRFGFGHKFYDLNYFETFSNIPLIHYTYEVIKKNYRKSSSQCKYYMFQTILTIICSMSPLAPPSRYM